MNFTLTRVDERLAHGQIITSWTKYLGVSMIWIIDDQICKDDFMKQVLQLSAPSGIKIEIYSVQQAVDKAELEKDSSSKVLLLFKRIQYVVDAVKQGLDIKEVNLGNLGSLAGRKSISKNVNLNPSEIEMVKELMDKGLLVYLQMLYTDSKVDIKNMI